MKLSRILVSLLAATQLVLAEPHDAPTTDAPRDAAPKPGSLIGDILALNEANLLEAEKDLRAAQAKLDEKEGGKTIGIVMTAAGLAGVAVAAVILKSPHAKIGGSTGEALLAGGGTLIGGAGATATVSGGLVYAISAADVPKAKKAVEEELERVKKAKARIAEIKARHEKSKAPEKK